MPAPFTPRQIDLARHALGFPNARRRSYRNSFVAGNTHPDYDDWYKMAQNGYAAKNDGVKLPFGGADLFRVTLAGAKAVLVGRETLDMEDFSQ